MLLLVNLILYFLQMSMDVIKADLNSVSYNSGKFLYSKFNFTGIQQDAVPRVMRATQFNAKSGGEVVVKDEFHHNVARGESVAAVQGEIQHIQEGHVPQVEDGDHYVITKQEDKPVEKNGVRLITTQGRGLSDPPTEQVGVDLYLSDTLNLTGLAGHTVSIHKSVIVYWSFVHLCMGMCLFHKYLLADGVVVMKCVIDSDPLFKYFPLIYQMWHMCQLILLQ
jgi:co-chaperonin GroES (HSP10)